MAQPDDDDDDMAAYWRDVKAAQQAKRASNREASALMLREAGVSFESKNDGAHLIVRPSHGPLVDFWPGTGLWIVRGRTDRQRGVKHLLNFCATRKVMERRR